MNSYPILDLEATGRQIKRIRTQKHISVLDICEYMGFENPQAVYKWQRGESLPTVDNLFALSRLLETPIEKILCEKEAAASFSYGKIWIINVCKRGTLFKLQVQ